MAPLVELTSVSKSYGGVPALTDVSLAIEPGAVHAILGENGAGKSTLMKLLAGVVAPESGTIAVDGTVRRFATPREAAACGIVCMFQELSLMPHLSVGDNMLIGDGGSAARADPPWEPSRRARGARPGGRPAYRDGGADRRPAAGRPSARGDRQGGRSQAPPADPRRGDVGADRRARRHRLRRDPGLARRRLRGAVHLAPDV